ncbi:IS110 family transposase [Pararhodobacter sp. CCB-MM2]|uniref:IS110 family transposase n=1 Tax=Pararhodobacter sp. CCB-MM2 TaxID=1786003 RepID=UPI001111C1D4
MVGLDLAKNAFHVCGAVESGRAVLRKNAGLNQVLALFGDRQGNRIWLMQLLKHSERYGRSCDPNLLA